MRSSFMPFARSRVTGAATVFCMLLAGGALAAPATAAPGGRAAEKIPGRYIVVYGDAVERPAAKTEQLERAKGFQSRFRYGSAIDGFAARLTDRQVEELRADPAVAFVSPDRPVEATAAAPLASGETVPAGVRRVEAATATTVRGPSSVNVAVIDTGIDLAHPQLNAADGKNCVGTGPAQDDEGHGTHVAGTIGARNDGAGVVGVAPGTKLYAVKVLDSEGSGTWSQIICGIDWVTSTRTDADPANDVAVANMSLGGPGTPVGACATTVDALHRAICASTAAGVTYVVAAGNDGWDFDYAPAPDVPAAYPEVLTVTAMGDSDGRGGALGPAPSCRTGEADDRYASFSNFPATSAGLAHTVAGPGVCVLSTAPGGGYATMSGTSMATPHLAALTALCLGEAGASGPCAGLAPAQTIARVRAEADSASRASAAYGFSGDSLRPVNGISFGFLAHAPALPDTVAPTVVSSAPASGATSVAPSTVVSVTFSEPMDPAATQAALSLVRSSDGTSVPSTYSWSGNTLTLRPSGSLAEGTSYTARLSTAARDLTGNPLATGRTWSFATSRTVVGYPAATALEAGTVRAGGYSRLGADDNLFFEVNSTTTGTRTAAWHGRVTGVSNAAKTLSVRYRGRASATCSQTVAVYNWSTLGWTTIDTRSVGTTEVQVDRAVTGTLASYVSGTSGDGEVRVRVRCAANYGFYSGADLLRVSHTR
jgi:subtilisin family serine protease